MADFSATTFELALTYGEMADSSATSSSVVQIDRASGGSARAALDELPSQGLACLQISARPTKGSGSRIHRTFELGSRSSPVVDKLPLGSLTFSGDAYAESCDVVGPWSRPRWSAGPVIATVIPTRVVDVVLVFSPVPPIANDGLDPKAVWGWANLHTHPASHLAWGADSEDNDGIFWGKPGLRLEDAEATLPTDLAQCSPDKHAGFDGDHVRHLTRVATMSLINQLTGQTHGASGCRTSRPGRRAQPAAPADARLLDPPRLSGGACG